MVSKRGQLTLFIILAIIIIAIAIAAFFIFRPQVQNTGEQVTTLKTYLSDVIRTQINDNIITVMQQGGYAYAPAESFQTPYNDVAYWVVENNSFYPSLEEMAYNVDLLNFLIGQSNLSAIFPEYQISQGTLESNTTILDDSVQVSVKWPITLKKGTITQTIEKFDFNYEVRLKKLYNAATYTADLVANDTLPSEMPQDMNLTVYVYDNASLYEIQDSNNNFKLNDQPYNFVFAVK